MTWVLGLTGGIAVGKTQVANHFGNLGAHLIDADIIARNLVTQGSIALTAIAEHFGESILTKGELNRAQLRERIFAHPADKKWLEDLLHPLIRQAILQEIHTPHSAPYIILVAPLLFENGLNAITQRALVVDASTELQLSRGVLRDGNPSTLKAIMAAQMSREQRLAQADDQLDNSGSWSNTQQAIAILHQQYLQLAAEYDTHNTLNPLPHV